MKLTYNWLKDFVDIRISPEKLADIMTIAGHEVVSFEASDGDFVFEIEVTPNRPDCLSVMGLAREVVAITGSKRKPLPAELKGERFRTRCRQKVDVRIENNKDCPAYSARVVTDVKVAPSPSWLAKRLKAVGLRPINNIVDITNYVMLETGQPLHAFDLKKLDGGQIIVRRARDNESIQRIDGKKSSLTPDFLVIADANKPVAVAGVMGGQESEVSFLTKDILLEAASFAPSLVRKARFELGISTDSSYRFERSVDSSLIPIASERAIRLILDIAGGSETGSVCRGTVRSSKKTVVFSKDSVCRLLGIDIPEPRIKRIFSSLNLKTVKRTKGKFLVTVPSCRQDINIEADLVEELARIYGYDKIPVSLPVFMPNPDRECLRENMVRESLRQAFLSQGLNEIISYSLLSEKMIEKLSPAFSEVSKVVNPLNGDLCVLRPSLFFGAMEALKVNFNRKADKIQVFEMGRVFLSDGERENAAVALSGEYLQCLPEGRSVRKCSIFQLKGVLEEAMTVLGVKDWELEDKPWHILEPGLSWSVKRGNKEIGFFGAVRREALEYFDIKKQDVFYAELQAAELYAMADFSKKYVPLASFPAIRRDISVVLNDRVSARQIKETILLNAGEYLEDVSVIDCYYGQPIPEGEKNLVFSCLYRSSRHTLTEEEISPVHEKAVGALRAEFNAQIR